MDPVPDQKKVSPALEAFIKFCNLRDDLALAWDDPEKQLMFKQGADFGWNYRHSEIHLLQKKLKELEDEVVRNNSK